MSFELQKTEFLEKLLHSDAIDPEGVHHEFNQGLHGQKIDFDSIETGCELFWLWVELVAEAIEQYYPEHPDVLIGVASGTNRIIEPVSRRLADVPEAFKTIKEQRSKPVLPEMAKKAITLAKPKFVLVIEDLGTRGTNSLSAVQSVKETGVERIEVMNTLQRSPELKLLRTHGISYRSILTQLLRSYSAEECRQPGGLCWQGWQLIPYKT